MTTGGGTGGRSVRTGDPSGIEKHRTGRLPTVVAMNTIESLTLQSPDPAAAQAFYDAAFGLDDRIVVGASDAPTSGYRGFTISLLVAQPSVVDEYARSALEAGATTLKPPKKSLWGYGAVVQAPDGSIWKLASSSKKNEGPGERRVDDIVLLLGVGDMTASKQFYVEHDFTVAKSFGRKYVEFDSAPGGVNLALYGRRASAKDAGVPPEGSGSHRLLISGDAGPGTDPDGFEWAAPRADGRAA